MDYYKKEVEDILKDIVAEGYETEDQVWKRWEEGETQDDFGCITGSRYCNTCKARQALQKAGFPWDYELLELFSNYGYDLGEVIKKGAEVVDAIICELVAMELCVERNSV